MSSGFNYGPRREDGQFTRHPTELKEQYVAPLRHKYIHVVCGGLTMIGGEDIVKTYATNPTFYDGTFCAICHDYFPLLIDGKRQFIWDEDGTPVGETHGEPGKDLRH